MPGRLLIADCVASNRVVLKAILSAARYDVLQACSEDDAVRLTAGMQPGVAIVDANVSAGGLETTCNRLRAESSFRRLPIIVTAGPDCPVTAADIFEAGGDALLRRPVTGPLLMAQVRALIRARETIEEAVRRRQTAEQFGFAEPAATFEQAPRFAVVDAVPGRAPVPAFANLPAQTRRMTARDALDLSNPATAPDVILLPVDDETAELALPLLSELRSRSATRHASFIAVMPPDRPRLAAQALDLGANDVAPSTCSRRELTVRLRRQAALKRAADELREAIDAGFRVALTDPLTRLHNRRYADYHLPRIHDEAHAGGRGYAVILCDLDCFKTVNDTHGHAAGDAVLVEVAARMRSALRGADFLARMGGEEFLAVLPTADPISAVSVALRLAATLRDSPIRLPGGVALTVTASFGVAHVPPTPSSVTSVLDRADRALYRAKALGRDRVEVSCTGADLPDCPLPDRPLPDCPFPDRPDQGLRGPLFSEPSSRSA